MVGLGVFLRGVTTMYVFIHMAHLAAWSDHLRPRLRELSIYCDFILLNWHHMVHN